MYQQSIILHKNNCVSVSLTGAHHGWLALVGTALPVGLVVGSALQSVAGCHMGGPERSVFSTEEAAIPFLRNAAAPADEEPEETPDETGSQGQKKSEKKSIKLLSKNSTSTMH